MARDEQWKEEFLRLYSSGRLDDVEKALELKRAHLPDRLYKFYAPSDYAFQGLEAGTVWLASPDTFNDPFDSGLVVDVGSLLAATLPHVDMSKIEELSTLGISETELGALITGAAGESLVGRLAASAPEADREEFRRLIEVVPEVMRRALAQSVVPFLKRLFQRGPKVACFTEHATSELLWAHYARSHQGFCIEFCFADVPDDLPQRRLLFPVLYAATRFDVTSVFRRLASEGGVPNHAIVAALHKGLAWAYEQEWRIVNPDGRDIDGFAIPMPKPRAVHAGVRMSDVDRARLQKICDAIGVPVLNAGLSEDGYEVILAATP